MSCLGLENLEGCRFSIFIGWSRDDNSTIQAGVLQLCVAFVFENVQLHVRLTLKANQNRVR